MLATVTSRPLARCCAPARRHVGPAAPGSPQARRCIAVRAKGSKKQQKISEMSAQTAAPSPPSRVAPQPQPAAETPPSTPTQPAAAAASRPTPSGRPAVETPQVVVDRMFGRVLVFTGLPLALGLVLFPVFWYLKVVAKLDYPIWVVYVASGLTFGGALLGITYGILSSSWDARREGSALGWTELQANLAILLNKDKDRA